MHLLVKLIDIQGSKFGITAENCRAEITETAAGLEARRFEVEVL